MFKSLAAILFIAGTATASSLNYGAPGFESAPTQSAFAVSTSAPLLEVARTPSDNRVPIESNILPSQQTLNAYQWSAYFNQGLANGIPSNAYVYVAGVDPTYNVSPAVVRTVPVPIAEKKVTVEAHQHVTVHPPTVRIQSPPVHQVQTVVNAPAVRYVSVPVGHSNAVADAFGSSVVTSPAVQAIPQRPAIPYVLVNPVPAVPVAAKKVTVEDFQSVTAFPPRAAYIVRPPESLNSALDVDNRPTVQVQVASNTVQSTAKELPLYVASTPAPFKLANEIQTAAPVAPIKPIIVKEVETPKTVTIESYQSVTAHPPTPVSPVKNVQTIANLPQYIPTPVQVPATNGAVAPALQKTVSVVYGGASPASFSALNRPIPVPVIYSAEELPTEQYIGKTKQIYPAPAVIRQQALVQPLALSAASYQNRVFTPLSTDLVAANVGPRYGGYIKAIRYSPASAVSRVSFNGNGVSYGW